MLFCARSRKSITGKNCVLSEALHTDTSFLLHFCRYVEMIGQFILLTGHSWGRRKGKKICGALSCQNARAVK